MDYNRLYLLCTICRLCIVQGQCLLVYLLSSSLYASEAGTPSYKADVHYFPSFLFHFMCKILLLLMQCRMWNTASVYVYINLRSGSYLIKVFLQHCGFGQILSRVMVGLQCSCISPAFCLSVNWPAAHVSEIISIDCCFSVAYPFTF